MMYAEATKHARLNATASKSIHVRTIVAKHARLNATASKSIHVRTIVAKHARLGVKVGMAEQGNFKLANGYYFVTVDNKVFNVLN